jgi:DNA-directed RNA polymerase
MAGFPRSHLLAQDADVCVAGVHDSFFTHAGSVDEMSAILRRTFVELHSRPLLQQLEAEFKALGAEGMPPIPPPGDLDISCVLDSPYFFS